MISSPLVLFTHVFGSGTGSILQQGGDLHAAFAAADLAGNDEAEVSRAFSELKLRYFTPEEIARLMGFPADFAFPADVTRKQCYRTLGNSLNVHVVAILLHHLLS